MGSAALVADGIHARTDGFTSLAVVAGGIGVLFGFRLANPIVGLIISAAIFILLIGTIRSVGRRPLDGVEPELVDRVAHALADVDGIDRVDRIRLRWNGDRLEGDAVLTVDSRASRERLDQVSAQAARSVREHLPNVDELLVDTTGAGGLGVRVPVD
ncbi:MULTISPECIES: cation diffusion facilitator family transporter [Microbacterium]|uniref:cation diffusion facilitator family transporter n=1 Tax=Microbacterium TaxID=33882 RepID=UPI002F3569DB